MQKIITTITIFCLEVLLASIFFVIKKEAKGTMQAARYTKKKRILKRRESARRERGRRWTTDTEMNEEKTREREAKTRDGEQREEEKRERERTWRFVDRCGVGRFYTCLDLDLGGLSPASNWGWGVYHPLRTWVYHLPQTWVLHPLQLWALRLKAPGTRISEGLRKLMPLD